MSNRYDSVTPKRRPVVRVILAVTTVVAIFGISIGAAQESDVTTVLSEAAVIASPVVEAKAAIAVPLPQKVQPAAPSEEVLELIAQLEERDQQIAVLTEQLAYLRQAQLANQVATDPGATGPASLSSNGRISKEENEAAMEQWRAGYTLGGGENLPAFEQTILPCESGSQPNPDTAVGRTDDWGRAQINRRTWKKRFESLTGADFETHIVNPALNGFMAAHVEQEQGLRAWTCWRKR